MITIHTLTAADFDDWNPLWQAYLVFYEAQLSDAVTTTAFARLTDPAEPMGSFLARDADGKPIGMVNWIDHRSNWSIENKCYLQDLFVNQTARISGVGRALIEAVGAAAKDRGCARVYWQTHETNHNAMKLYDRIATKSGFLVYDIDI